MKLSTSLSNLVYEWVSIQKTPASKISTQSSQDIRNAVEDEKRSFCVRVKNADHRKRCNSESLLDRDGSTKSDVVMRPKNQRHTERTRPQSLIEVIKRRMSPPPMTRSVTISEEDPEFESCHRPFSRASMKSETLNILIT